MARWVSAAAVHFEETAKILPPWRKSPGFRCDTRFSRFQTKSTEGTPTLLVFGGSQGARAINQAMIRCLAGTIEAGSPRIHIIHQTGERDYNEAQAAYRTWGSLPRCIKFIDDMPAFFCARRSVLCRSGASTVAEITAAGKPAVFVPFPRAADDHQRAQC